MCYSRTFLPNIYDHNKREGLGKPGHFVLGTPSNYCGLYTMLKCAMGIGNSGFLGVVGSASRSNCVFYCMFVSVNVESRSGREWEKRVGEESGIRE